jgi:hypothetical protein
MTNRKMKMKRILIGSYMGYETACTKDIQLHRDRLLKAEEAWVFKIQPQ